MAACEMCGQENPLSVVPWLIWDEQDEEFISVGRVKDVAACEWCVLNAGFCEAMGHHADNDDVSGFYRLDDETRPTWSCCEIHVTECLEQLVEEVVDGQRSLDAVLALIDDYSTGHGQLWGEYGDVMRRHARRLLAAPATDKRGRINTGLADDS